MIYKTLYKIDSKNRNRVWFMEQEGNKHRTHAGQHGGNIVVSAWTEVEGKNIGKANETTPEEQTTKEIEAKYVKQLRLGYTETLGKVHTGHVKPVLAHKLKDNENFASLSSGHWAVQTKYNGVRCIATASGLWSRTGKHWVNCSHIEEALKPFFEQYPDAVLDGELFNYDLRRSLNELISVVKQTKPKTADIERSKEIVKYYVYDGYKDETQEKLPYYLRKEWLEKVLKDIPYYEKVDSTKVYTRTALDKIYNDLLSDGHEGIILRNLHSPYEHKRTKNLLKHKPLDDDEFVIIGVEEAKGNWAGTGRKVIVQMKDGKTFTCNFMGTTEECAQFLKDQEKWIGKTVTVQYNGFTGKGTPNYAQFDYKNAIKE